MEALKNEDSFAYKILQSWNLLDIYGKHLIEVNDNIQNSLSSPQLQDKYKGHVITELVIQKGEPSDKPWIRILLIFDKNRKAWGAMQIISELSDEKLYSLYETMNIIFPALENGRNGFGTISAFELEIDNGTATGGIYFTAYNLKSLLRKVIVYSITES